MLWFTVWTLLVVGTLVGAFFLGRRLWRSGRALLVELERAGDVLARLDERSAALAGQAPAHPVRPVDLADVEAARDRRALTRLARERRRRVRAARHQAVHERWRSFSR